MFALTCVDDVTGFARYVGWSAGRYVRVDSLVGALLWEDMNDLMRWMMAADDRAVMHLDALGASPIEVDMDWTGAAPVTARARIHDVTPDAPDDSRRRRRRDLPGQIGFSWFDDDGSDTDAA